MKKYCVSRYICFLLSFCLVFALPAFAAGKLTIQPFIEMQTRVDSNFYKHETETKSVNSYAINPGVVLKYSNGKSVVAFNYDTKIVWEDGENDDRHNLGISFKTQTTNILGFNIGNTLQKTRDPASADDNANSIDRYRYYVNTFTPQMDYKLSDKFNLNLKYTNKITDYLDDDSGEGEDALENRIGLVFLYQMNSKTDLDLDYQYWWMDYDKSSVDYTSSQIFGNVNYRFHDLALSAGAGYHSREFDQSVSSGDFGKFVWKMGISGESNPQDNGLSKSSMSVSLSQNYNDAGQGDSYFTTTKLDANFTYLFTPKIYGRLGGTIQNAEYETSTRKDDRWSITPAVDYLLNDNFTLGVETGYEERDSNTSGKNFDNTYGMIKVKYSYGVWSR